MTQTNATDLTDYYTTIRELGKLRTNKHAERWSEATLHTLALNLDRGTKQKLANALPEVLSAQLKRKFWLLHFRDKSLTCNEFQKITARRAGNTDESFARYPVIATFHGLKSFINDSLNDDVANTLSPELSQMWQDA
ncbi:MAG: hypothetical protein CSA11_05300 [Chloroflexi bacterium]|nr:MAG: hypothetical protein CSA11_05300 [Chloroflexota bacterium]